MYQIINADILEFCRNYTGEPFHAVLCDPPYELGFMGKEWDKSGIAFNPETWLLIASVLHDGAFIFAYASSRGWHRQAVAMEDAGLIIHPSIYGYAFGSGFPKATRVDTQVDKAAGKEQEVVGKRDDGRYKYHFQDGNNQFVNAENNPRNEVDSKIGLLKQPATDLAKAWQGHRYGRQALKPALEPIIVAQKPYRSKPVDCITRTGAGAFNIDGSRIGTTVETHPRSRTYSAGHMALSGNKECGAEPIYQLTGEIPSGRWASNLILSHTPDCEMVGDNWNCTKECPIRRLNESQGIKKRSQNFAGVTHTNDEQYCFGNKKAGDLSVYHKDEGYVSRYFYNADFMYERLEQADRLIYTSKASRAERNAGLSLDSSRLVCYNISLWNEKNTTHTAKLAQLLVDTETLAIKVIDVSGVPQKDVMLWNIVEYLKTNMGKSLKVNVCTTKTGINWTTELKTLNWLTSFITSESIAVAKKETMAGTSLVVNAQDFYTNPNFISQNKDGFNPSANGVELTQMLSISASEGYCGHPTVKSIKANQHLSTILLPPEQYTPRRILVPFSGVASEMIACILSGWDNVVGVELTEEYIPIAEARLKYWSSKKESEQRGLFE